jgi:hypothetical protein
VPAVVAVVELSAADGMELPDDGGDVGVADTESAAEPPGVGVLPPPPSPGPELSLGAGWPPADVGPAPLLSPPPLCVLTPPAFEVPESSGPVVAVVKFADDDDGSSEREEEEEEEEGEGEGEEDDGTDEDVVEGGRSSQYKSKSAHDHKKIFRVNLKTKHIPDTLVVVSFPAVELDMIQYARIFRDNENFGTSKEPRPRRRERKGRV